MRLRTDTMEFEIPRRSRLGGWIAYAPGAALILFGILILIWPQLLVALIAGTCIAIGIVMLTMARRFESVGRFDFVRTFRDRFRG